MPVIGRHTSSADSRAPLSTTKATVLAVTAVLLAAIPAWVTSGIAASLLPVYDEHRHAAYVAMALTGWGALSLGLVALAARLRPEGAAIGRLDLALGAASVVVLGTWVFSIYEWNIAKFARIELDGVGPITLYWPLFVILIVTLLPLVGGTRPVLLVVASVGLVVLAADMVLAAAGALRDGSVSMWGIAVGLLYFLQIAILASWLAVRTRTE